MAEIKYESSNLCAACGGACCKSKGCSLSPEDMIREIEQKEHTREIRKEVLEHFLPAGIFREWQDKMEADGTFERCEDAYMEYQMEKRNRQHTSG